jgi:hypothetical protein
MTSNAKNPLRKEDDPRAMDQIKIGNKLVGRRFSVSSLSREFLEYRRVIAAPPHSDPRFRIGLHCPRHRPVRPRCGGINFVRSDAAGFCSRRFLRMATRSFLRAVPRTGRRLSSHISSMDNGPTPH